MSKTNKKILFIEDEEHLQKLLGEELEDRGFEVIKALNGAIGLKLALKKQPDLILLDLILPKKDGFEVLETLKKDPKTKKIPVIILTNLETAPDVQKALDLGASTYLVKANYKLAEITKKITKHI